MIWILLGLLIGGYSINSYFINKAVRDATKADSVKKELVIKNSINELVATTGAINNWEKLLGKGEEFRLEPIMSLELEELWIQNRPILFIGSIKDIATYNETLYTLTVERGLLTRSDFEFSTVLQLSLLASKHQIDNLLTQHPSIFKDYDLINNVAVIAKVKRIKTSELLNEETGREEIKIGEGELVDVLYIADINS